MVGLVTESMQKAIKTVVPVEGTLGTKDIIQLIIEDHNRGREMYRQYMHPDTTARQKQLLAWHMIRESSIHASKEEQVLYPAMRLHVGDLAADDSLDAHQDLKLKLTELTNTHISNPNFDGMVQEYMQMLLEHMREEEDELLPKLMSAEGVTPDYLAQLGHLFETAKLMCPSRPHPWAPNKPPLKLVVDSALVPIDFLRDMIRFEGAPPL